MFCEVDIDGYFISDAPFASGDEPNVRPHIAPDGTKPDGMRKARYVNDSWVDEEAAQLAAELAQQNLLAIKVRARAVITARIPEWKQGNLLARKAELQDILIQGGVLTPAEQAEWDYMGAEWAWIKAVRGVSDQAEIDGTLVDSIMWP